ncbi:Pentatricopeptide repeat-containing protein, mitochondrial [Prunus dulcis]|uniref:Pentatricopeptide repeat-containing protein, mitochondrial n=1 Tax=Prunus dulcis TaxID=3755 RepID=A0A4Y1QLH5_PRUDU|nr:Pentatricopeptide repeat-containing protein, mitochondrial [Prunus dulcis]
MLYPNPFPHHQVDIYGDIFLIEYSIEMYSKCGLVGDGFRVFDEMPDRNLVTWTLMISAAVQDGQFEWGLEINLGLIRSGLRPNEFTIVGVLKGCAECASTILKHMNLARVFIVLLGKLLEDIESAKGVIESMLNLDAAGWDTMIGGYAQCGYGLGALRPWSLEALEP